jgi:Bacterial extracellular solute-binding proteins, family 5 Middle.
MRRNKIKLLSAMFALCLITTLISSCVSNEPFENTSESKVISDIELKNVQHLIIGTTAGNNTFSAVSQRDAFGRMNYNAMTQGNFVYRDKNGKVQPYFFQSFDISEDGKKIVFTIPLDAVWHDGVAVTAEDIIFTFEFMRDVRKVGSLHNLEMINQLSKDTFELVFSEADAYYWINSSCNNNSCVFAKHIWEKVEDPSTYIEEDAMIGCGPFKLVSYDTDAQSSYYEAVHENNYAGDITIEAITLQTYSGEDTLMMAMMNGEVDAMFNYANPIDATIIDTMHGIDYIDLGESEYSGNFQLTYGMERRAGEDIAFRKAVRFALNYSQLGMTINGNYAKAPGAGIIPPSAKGYDASLPILEQNIEEALKILDEAGYIDVDGDGFREFPDGTTMEILVTPQFAASQELLNRIADVIMDSLKRVGIRTKIDEASLANSEVWEANIVNGQYDLSIGYTTSGMAAYASAFRYFLADSKVGDESWIWGTYHNDKFSDTFFAMQKAISEEDYIMNVKILQGMASEVVFAQALSWETAFFPYRTDKYVGWDNYPSWGVIHARTWHELKQK